VRRYGLTSVRLTSVALEQWGFPYGMTLPLKQVDDYTSMDGGLLRGAFEVSSRLTIEDYEPVPIVRLTCGHLREDDLVPILDQVRSEAAELRRAMFGDAGDDDEEWTV
jgi:hypothetical protein